MGQAGSSPLSDAVTRARDTVLRRAAPLHELTTLPYDQLLEHVDSLNSLCEQLGDASGQRLRFRVDEPSAGSPLLWRGTVRVDCEKVTAAGETQSSRPLSLRQFLQARATLQQQHAWLATQPGAPAPAALSSSRLLDVLEADDGCCCICLERAPDTSLPCAHAYCTVCIEQWSPAHKTCPMCRQDVESTDDAWVMPEAATGSQLREDVVTSVMRLATDDR